MMTGKIKTKRWNEPIEAADGIRIFVARYRPRYLRKGNEPWDEWLKKLAPSRELHAAWYGKGGQPAIGFDEFVTRYRKEMEAQQEVLSALAQRLLAGETITFLCYCADKSRCHRILLKDMVELRSRIRTSR
jgi:uncharacterized protein YeaO (DUF488 family)